MKTNEQKQRRENWQKIIDEYLKSNMTQKAFCEQRNLSVPQFVYYYGQFKHEKELPISKPSFVPINIARHEKPVTTSEIKLSLPNGFQCVFPSHIDAAQIKRLVEALLSC